MKTTILEISEPAMLAALAEMKTTMPDAKYWEVVVTLKQDALSGLSKYKTEGVPQEAIDELLTPKFHVGVHVLPRDVVNLTEYISGYDHQGMNFAAAFGDVVAAIPTAAQLLKKKREQLQVLESELMFLESAVRS